jgi:hypothetical protein
LGPAIVTVVVPPAGQRRQRRRVELAVQPLAPIVDRMNQVATILDADRHIPPAVDLELSLQSLARLPVAQRRIAQRVRQTLAEPQRSEKGQYDEKANAHEITGLRVGAKAERLLPQPDTLLNGAAKNSRGFVARPL